MKRFYSLLLGAMVGLAANATNLYMVGEFNNWGLKDPAAKFTDKGNDVYTLTYSGTVKGGFKINDGAWTNPDFNIGANQGNSSLTADQPLTVISGNWSQNIVVADPEGATNATFTLDLKAKTLTYTLASAQTEEPAQTLEFYLIGSFNGWKLADPNAKFTQQANGTYVLKYDGLVTNGFKLNCGAWDDKYNYGGSDIDHTLVEGTAFTLYNGGSSSNLFFDGIEAVKNPTFTFDSNAGTLTYTGEATATNFTYRYAFHGQVDEAKNWTTKEMTKNDDGNWELKGVELKGDGTNAQFGIKKIIVETGTDAAWIAGMDNGSTDGLVAAQPEVDNQCTEGGKNFTIPVGTYDFTYNPTDNLLSIKSNNPAEASVGNLDAEQAPVEYFNLQGVRVEKPVQGVYLMRQGSKVSKVMR